MIFHLHQIWVLLKQDEISSHELNELGLSLYEQGFLIEAQVCWQRAYLLEIWNPDILHNVQSNQEIFWTIPLYFIFVLLSLGLSICIIKVKKMKHLLFCFGIALCLLILGLIQISKKSSFGRVEKDAVLYSQIMGLGESKEVLRGDYAKVIQIHGDELQIELVNNKQRYWISSSLFYTFEPSNRLEKLQSLIEDKHD
jgi:hypothetical protein